VRRPDLRLIQIFSLKREKDLLFDNQQQCRYSGSEECGPAGGKTKEARQLAASESIYLQSGPAVIQRSKDILFVCTVKPFPAAIGETVYTTAELAKMWKLSVDTIRSLFEHEPDVIVLQKPRRGIRRYRTLRIPASVADRVFRRFTVPAA
jgi:hypothetical protein